VAGLNGQAWLQFLADSSGQREFVESPAEALASGVYQPQPQYDAAQLEQLRQMGKQWLLQHRYSTYYESHKSQKGKKTANESNQLTPDNGHQRSSAGETTC